MEQLPKREKFEIDVFAATMASLVVVAALAVIFTFPGWNGPIKKLNVRAATTFAVTNGQMNSFGPGAFVPPSSPALALVKMTLSADQAAQTLTGVTVSFGGTGFDTTDLATLTNDTNSGVALYRDNGTTVGQFDFDGTDSRVNLQAVPTWTSTNTTLVTEVASPPALTNGGASIFYIVIKTSSTISNNDQIQITLLANSIVATGPTTGPASNFVGNYVQADTAAVAIQSVEAFENSPTVTVRFNKPVQRKGGGNLTSANFSYTDISGGSKTISSVAHTAGQNIAVLTLSGNVVATEVDGTPSTLAAVVVDPNKITDMGGAEVANTAKNFTSSLSITTNVIPAATAGTTYAVGSPLVTFAAVGGTPSSGNYKWSVSSADAAMLSSKGFTSITATATDNTTGKLFGTGAVANTPGSFPFTLIVTDFAGSPATASKPLTLNIMPSGGGGIPGVSLIEPAGGPRPTSSAMTVTITGANTHFSGSSRVQFMASGTEDTNICASGGCIPTSSTATSIIISVNIGASATLGNHDVQVTTGSEIAFMPNGFSVFAAGGSGLNLLMPGDNATNVPLPPGFSFSPSTNAGVNSYRVTVKSTSNFAGTALWDYTFPKPADVQNTNGSHCTATSCNLMYGQGTFSIITQPTPLAPNTTYYWQVRTYAELTASVNDVATPLELTPVRGFTTVSSITDVTPPMIMHRPVMQLKTGADRILVARVNDNLATPTSVPALTTSLKYCNSSASCDPAGGSTAVGTYVAAGYWKYTITQAVVDAANSATNGIRYFITASDGTNTSNFKQPDNITPFTISIAALATTHKLLGAITDQAAACLAGVYVFADGTAFNNLASATTCAGGTYSLGSIPPGSYDLVALKDGYAEKRLQGVFAIPTADSTPAYNFSLTLGGGGGFGGDTTNPRVKFTGPMDGMTNMPGGDANFKVMVIFTKAMSQSTITATNLTVNEVSSSGTLTDITSTKGSWTYYPTAPNIPMIPPESNIAVWSFSGSNTFGDNKNIAVKINSNVTDTAGNAIQGNQSDGSYVFTFTTGSSANFSGFDNTTGTFSGGGTFGAGQFIPPHVLGTTPPPGASAVPTNTKVVINFSEAMADDGGGYLLKDNVKLFTVSGTTETDVSSTAISTVALDTTKRNATVTLSGSYNSGAFAVSTSYRIKVLGGAKSGTGITLSPPNMVTNSMFQADFKTGTGTDLNPPTILGSYPDNNATGSPVNVGAVSVGFSKDMSASTITTSTFYLSVGSTSVNGTVQYDSVGRQAMFMPQSALSPNTTYTLNLTAGIQGINSVAIAAATKSFTTGAADTATPSVSFVNADDYNLAISFSEPMNAAKATDTANFAASVIKPANYTIKYSTPPADSASGTSITLPATANFTYDASTNTVSISGYHDSGVTGLAGKEIYISIANVKDLSGNVISGTTTSKAPIANSATTKGALGPGAFSGDAFSQQGGFVPTNFSSTTFGFAPPVEVRPFNMMAGQTTIYGVRIPISTQIPDGGMVVLTFPTGFDVTNARQDVNSPMRTDLNGPGTGIVTFKCASAGAPTGASCAGTANSDDTSTAQGGLAGDGVVVNTSSRTVTVYLSGATRSQSGDTHDFLTIDIAGIKNSTVPKDFNTTGYTVDVKTKNSSTVLESMTSQPFFIQGISGTAYTLSGTITATSAVTGTAKVYLMSPMTGPLDATSATFAAGSAAYSFTNLPAGDYMLFTDQSVTLGANEYVGKSMPERVVISEAADVANSGANDDIIPYNITLTNASGGSTTAVTVNVTGPASEPLDVFAGSTTGFRVRQITLDGAGSGTATLNLPDGEWMIGVGPQMPKGPMSGPPPAPTYVMPKPKATRIANPVCTVEGVAGCTIAYTLSTASLDIKGVVKDGSSKVMANAEVYAYSPQGGFGTHGNSDSVGSFDLKVNAGSYIVGSFVPGMPPSKEIPVIVQSDGTLLIDGVTTAITANAAATSFVVKVAKPDYTISGKVTDGTSAVQGASVYAYRTDGPGHANAMTDSSGNYTLYVSTGAWKVGTFLPQYGQLTEVTVTVSTASVSNQNFSPSVTNVGVTFYNVSGTVTSGGSPVQGAFVRIKGNSTSNEAVTGTDGTYTMKVPGCTASPACYTIRAFIPNVGEVLPTDTAAFNLAADATGKDFSVTTNTITITFSSSVTKAFVDIFSTTGVGNHLDVNNSTTGTVSLPSGSYQVRVNVPGTALGPTDIADNADDALTTAYNSTTGVMTVDGNEGLKVTIPANLRTITGTVKNASGTNIANAWVEITNPTTGVHYGAQSDSTTPGTNFSLKVVDGTYFINAMKPSYFRQPTSLTVSATTPAQTITMAAASTTISGQVKIGSAGAPNAYIRAEKQGGGFSGTQADASGNYILPVDSGTWRVYGVAEGYQEAAFASNPVDVTGGSVAGKDITLATAISVNAPKSKPITPATGGTLEDTDAGIKITIPANALSTSTSAGTIEVKETTNVSATNTSQPVSSYDAGTSSYAPVGKTISFTDSTGTPITNFSSPVTVEMTYTKAEVAATKSGTDTSVDTKAEADKLSMTYWDSTNQNWSTLPSTVTYKDSNGAIVTSPASDLSNVASVVVTASTTHFSNYAPSSATDPSAPSTPSGLAKSSATTTTITMGWAQVSGATSYDIYRSATSGGTFARLGSEPTVSSGPTVTYTDSSSLSASTTYYYKITALNASGESSPSSEVSMATSAAASSGTSSGGGTYIPAPTTQTPTTTKPITTDTTSKTLVTTPVEASPITQIISESTKIATANAEAIAEEVGKSRDLGLEKRYESTIVARIMVANTPAEAKARVVNFVTYGTSTTQALGAGERGGVVNSFRSAFGKVPSTEADWQDVIKIANGRWPSTLSATREKAVSVTFKKIYLRDPNRSNARDDAAVTVMAYGLRSAQRNMNSEKAAINSYKVIFKKAPTLAVDWDAVRAIAYSGAKR